MPVTSILTVAAVIAYLVGAIPFSLIIAKSHGVDIRKVGSGNVGATNVLRSVGKTAGFSALALDIAKGFIPTFGIPLLLKTQTEALPASVLVIVCAVAAICGHVWPIYLRFKGGKGIATSAGALIALAPAAVGIGLLIWAIMLSFTRYVSLASITAAAAIPVVGWYLYASDGVLLPSTLTAIGLLAIVRHHSNIRRLIKGQESRISLRKSKSDGASQ